MKPVRARVGGDLTLFAEDLTPKAIGRIVAKLQVPNPKYVAAQRMGRWTGGEPSTFNLAIEMPDGLHVPRGAHGLVKELLARDDFQIQVVEDRRARGEPLLEALFPIWRDHMHALGLRPYQEEALFLFRRHTQGLVVLPCGCGKTRLGIAAIGAIAMTALVVVPTRDLADQWIDALHAAFPFQKTTVGRLGGGKHEADRAIVVAIDDALVPFLRTAPPEWPARFGLFLVDEAHHVPSATFRSIVGQFPARWRLGLTATPTREDGLERVIDWTFGLRLVEKTTEEMIRKGYLANAIVEEIPTDFRFAFDGPADDPRRVSATEEALADDMVRNAAIADRVTAEAAAGESILVLCQRREHVHELVSLIEARGVQARGLTGKSGKRARKDAIGALRAGDAPVVVATSLADEGLDVARLSRVVLAYPQKARGATTQRLGRLLRQWPGKKPRLLDFVDPCVPMFARRAQARRRIWRSMGLAIAAPASPP